jgi:hypothetical protein
MTSTATLLLDEKEGDGMVMIMVAKALSICQGKLREWEPAL